MEVKKEEISIETAQALGKLGIWLPVKMSEIRTLTLHCKDKNGKIQTRTIYPKKIWHLVNTACDELKSGTETSFLADYLEKPIIFSLGAKTALTNGSRIIFCPLFATWLAGYGNQLFNKKSGDGELSQAEKLALLHPKLEKDSKYVTLLNQGKCKLVQYVIVHECYHCIYQHVRRTSEIMPKITLPAEMTIANFAADLEINRDIEGTFERFTGCTKLIDGVWFLDQQWLDVNDGKPMNKDVFEQIYRKMIKNINSSIQNSIKNSQQHPHQPQQVREKKSNNYKKGWQAAHDAVVNKIFDPLNTNMNI